MDTRLLKVTLALTVVACSTQIRAETVGQVAVRVVGKYEQSVFLDKGWLSGIRVGDQVAIVSESGEEVPAIIVSAASNSSRCATVDRSMDIDVGAKGVAKVKQADLVRLPPVEDSTPERGAIVATRQATNEAPSSRGTVVEVRVTASSSRNIFLDKGASSGIRPGDEIVFFPVGQGIFSATVKSVSRSSARCTPISGIARVDVGTRGELSVPGHRVADTSGELSTQRLPRRQVPQHPPWSHPPENWSNSMPLLAPTYSRSASDRAPEFHGRLYSQYLHTWNQGRHNNQYSFGRLGTAIWMENPFRRGGSFYIDGEFSRRDVFLFDSGENVDHPGQLDNLSYSWGGTEDQPLRWELGRFLSYELPQFGRVDGAELVYRTNWGHRLGFSFGFLPEPFPNRCSGEDWQLAAFYRFILGADESLSSAIGFQKTWHKGTPDRDLLVYTVDYVPNSFVSVHGTLWGDFYDARDALKSESFEFTQANVQPLFRMSPTSGVGTFASFVRWPELLRHEFSPFLENQLINGRTFRYGIFTWRQLRERMRLDVRTDHWEDESDQDGTSWNASVAFQDLRVVEGELSLGVYGTDGTYSSGPGGRISFYRHLPWCFASLAYDLADFEYFDDTKLTRQSFRANLDFNVASGRSVSFFTDYLFGQQNDALQTGLFVQQRL